MPRPIVLVPIAMPTVMPTVSASKSAAKTRPSLAHKRSVNPETVEVTDDLHVAPATGSEVRA